MTKFSKLLVITLLSACFWSLFTKAAFADQAVVDVHVLNVREGPGTNFDRLGEVHASETFTILEEKNNWLKIQWGDEEGWVAKWLTQVTADEESEVYYSKVDYLRIRSAPGLDNSVKDHLMKNEEAHKKKINGDWMLVETDDTEGWVHKSYLSIQKVSSSKKRATAVHQSTGKIKVTTPILNVRSEGSTSGKVITTVQSGEVYEYIQQKNDWFLIKWDGSKTGWIAGWLVNKVSGGDETGATERFVTLEYNGTNFRSGPSTSYKAVGNGQKGESFEIIEKKGRWYKIKYNKGHAYVAGWIVNETSSKKQSPYQLKGSLAGKTIMVDAGHGGRDPGAIGRAGSYEKKLTMNTTEHLKRTLERKGAEVLLTRKRDTFVSLSLRTFYSNHSEADAFISIHYNSAPSAISANGISTYYYHDNDRALAQAVQTQMVSATGLRDREVRYGNFHVIRENQKPSVLLELGFLSNGNEEQTVRTNDYQRQVTAAITQGLINYFSES